MSATTHLEVIGNLMVGELSLPANIVQQIPEEYQELTEQMFQSLWYTYKKNKKPSSLAYWADQFEDNDQFLKIIHLLSKEDWIDTKVIPQRNWAEVWLNEDKLLELVSEDRLKEIRKDFKINKYMMTYSPSQSSNKTKTPKGIKDVGLVREGYKKAGNHEFRFDTKYLSKYKNSIKLNLTKSIRLLHEKYEMFKDDTDYESVALSILDKHLKEPNEVYTLGECVSDSRGRAISQSLKKVFNPISNKDARSLLVIDDNIPFTYQGISNIYLFIAETLGYKPSNLNEKISLGIQAYNDRKLPKLKLDDDEGRSKLYEHIWLERVYEELDSYYNRTSTFYWKVPIELDATASMLQIQGVLLNHAPFLDMTNVIGEELKDAWSFPGMEREQFKQPMMRILYGSSQTPKEVWKAEKMEYTPEQVSAFNQELKSGAMAVANDFKEFLIQNVDPKPTMKVKIWKDEFEIRCNRYKNVGDYYKSYQLWDSKDKVIKNIHHVHTKRVEDLEQFRRYFVTLLIHNLDSQVCDNVSKEMDWVIPIYDAWLVHPAESAKLQELYTGQLEEIYENRETILKDYFQSTGITASPKALSQWGKLQTKIQPVNNNEFKALKTALK